MGDKISDQVKDIFLDKHTREMPKSFNSFDKSDFLHAINEGRLLAIVFTPDSTKDDFTVVEEVKIRSFNEFLSYMIDVPIYQIVKFVWETRDV